MDTAFNIPTLFSPENALRTVSVKNFRISVLMFCVFSSCSLSVETTVLRNVGNDLQHRKGLQFS